MVKQVGKAEWQKSMNNAKGYKNYFTRVRIMLWILICALSLLNHLSSQISRESKLSSTKVTVQASSIGGFIYDAIEHWIIRDKAIRSLPTFYLVCSNYYGAMTISCKICSQFGRHTVDGISYKSQPAYHSLRMLSFGSAGKIYFCQCLWNSWDRGFIVFSIATAKSTVLARPWRTFGLFFALLKSRYF